MSKVELNLPAKRAPLWKKVVSLEEAILCIDAGLHCAYEWQADCRDIIDNHREWSNGYPITKLSVQDGQFCVNTQNKNVFIQLAVLADDKMQAFLFETKDEWLSKMNHGVFVKWWRYPMMCTVPKELKCL